MFYFNIVYFLFFVNIEIVHSSFVYDLFIRLDLILNNVILSIMTSFVTIITHRFFEYDVLFEFS